MALIVTPDHYVIDSSQPTAALDALLQNLPGFDLIGAQQKADALANARIPDSNGVWPGQPGYINSYDIYYAALQLVGFLQAQPVVRQSSSEGTSVAVDAPSWDGLLAYYRSMSPICQASGTSALGVIQIPDGPHVRRTDMSGRYDDYGDVDTDLG